MLPDHVAPKPSARKICARLRPFSHMSRACCNWSGWFNPAAASCGSAHIDLPVPVAAGRRRPFATQVAVRRTGQIPAAIQRVAERGSHAQDVFRVGNLSLNIQLARMRQEIVDEPNTDFVRAFLRGAIPGSRAAARGTATRGGSMRKER